MEIGEAQVKSVILHKVGNRLREEPLVLAEECISISEDIANILLYGYLRGIVRSNNLFTLFHETDVSLNDLSHHISNFETEKIDFIELSKRLATHLYSSTHHPNIASGDLFIILFNKIKINDKFRSAIGIYKVESQQQYLSAHSENGTQQLEVIQGINPELIDKGALIIEGFNQVYVVDRLSNRTKYWIEDFLKAKQIPNERAKSAIALGLVTKVSNKIENPIERQTFGQEISVLCTKQESISGIDIKNISEKYLPIETLDSELKQLNELKGEIELQELILPAKKFENKLQKVLNKINLGKDISLILPNDFSFKDVTWDEKEKQVHISIVLEKSYG
ncbi:nucleoid-associated protein [Acinetobacter baumannii]|nr:nucleoid-associated protein [Acinetobacter baumannii]MDC4933272.1 nucleoid-associated protein [Acinetobacter baumannii]